ncbi:MAG: hypothetical protein WCF20_09585 [Methylovirgula sp.]
MNFPSRFGFAVAYSASSLFILVFGPAAFAADRSLPDGAARWMALDNCAAYGPEFTSVEGTQACAKIGGHVRVEFGSRNFGQSNSQATDHEWGRGGTAPAAMRTEGLVGSDSSEFPTAQHLRLRQDAAPTYGGWYLH